MPAVEVKEIFTIPDPVHLLARNEFRRFSDLKNGRGEALRELFRSLVSPRLIYKVEKIDSIGKKTVCLKGGARFESSKLAKALEHCEDIICFIATIGSDVEKVVARLTDSNRLSEAYVMDSLGSMTIEHIVNGFHNDMDWTYRTQRYGATYRFSPGYCDWPITDQRKLFHVLNSDRIGVTLTESCLMHPRKSVSGVFGIFPDGSNCPISRYNPCTECKNPDCIARRN